MADRQPARAALKIPRGRTADGAIDYLSLSFAELDAEVDAWVSRLSAKGVRRGDRVLVMVRQGLPLIASVFALFKYGAVPVVIDPGMGLRSFFRCVRHSRPRALLGIPLAQVLSRVARSAFSTIAVRVKASSALTGRLTRASAQIAGASIGATPMRVSTVETAEDELAAILFTSGSTGAPKGVCYTHGMFDAQVRAIREAYGIEPGEIDLPLLPIFALFNPALGMTTIVPEIDPRRPAAVDPAKILQAILQENVTNSFGSPTLWRKIATHADERGIVLPSLRRVLCAGAPVPPSLWAASTVFLTHGRLHSPYGATEALPVSTIGADEVLAETAVDTRRGAGTCVGRPLPGVTVKIIPVTDGPVASLSAVGELPAGAIGEIVVGGAMVTQGYDALPEADVLSKIPAEAGAGASTESPAEAKRRGLWHRMGDCGYLDTRGRLWFCGRKAERVETAEGTWFTEQVEPIFNLHPFVLRSALVGLGPKGSQRPVLILEVVKGMKPSAALKEDLSAWARIQPQTVNLARIADFLFHPSFPVDVRHNAKIHRLTLAKWAEETLRKNRGA